MTVTIADDVNSDVAAEAAFYAPPVPHPVLPGGTLMRIATVDFCGSATLNVPASAHQLIIWIGAGEYTEPALACGTGLATAGTMTFDFS